MVQPVVAPSPAERLAARLDDPATAEALNDLLDHADLLAILVIGLSEFVGRGETITDTIGEALQELKTVAAGSSATFDFKGLLSLAQQGSAIAPKLAEKLPVIERALEPGPNGVDVVDVVAIIARAASDGAGAAEAGDLKIKGIFGLMRALKDEDVSRALGLGLAVAKSIGHELHAAESRSAAHRPSPRPRPA